MNYLIPKTFFFTWLAICTPIQAASISISPIDPMIEHEQTSAALWMENRDKTPITLQVRVMKWAQAENSDQYSKQAFISASPPFINIAPGKRQMVRLVKNGTLSPKEEQAYRIIIDEIPQRKSQAEEQEKMAMGLDLKMRYIIPLFVSGEGIWTNADPARTRNMNEATYPTISYRLVNEQGKQHLEIKNTGIVHARLSNMVMKRGSQEIPVAEGLWGYVLPNSIMRLPLTKNILLNQAITLESFINQSQERMAIPAH